MKMKILVVVASMVLAAPAMAAQTVTYNADPTTPLTYGSGNDFGSANNAVVGTTPTGELALRAHVPGVAPAASSSTGVYTFNIGQNVSFDYSLFGGAVSGANVLLTNLLTGDTAHFNPETIFGSAQPNGAFQNSEQLGFGFLNNSGPFAGCCGNLNFSSTVNDTYRIDLTGGGNTITAFAQVGDGAVAAVPEPATWGMMLLGFGAMGAALRRSRRKTGSAIMQVA